MFKTAKMALAAAIVLGLFLICGMSLSCCTCGGWNPTTIVTTGTPPFHNPAGNVKNWSMQSIPAGSDVKVTASLSCLGFCSPNNYTWTVKRTFTTPPGCDIAAEPSQVSNQPSTWAGSGPTATFIPLCAGRFEIVFKAKCSTYSCPSDTVIIAIDSMTAKSSSVARNNPGAWGGQPQLSLDCSNPICHTGIIILNTGYDHALGQAAPEPQWNSTTSTYDTAPDFYWTLHDAPEAFDPEAISIAGCSYMYPAVLDQASFDMPSTARIIHKDAAWHDLPNSSNPTSRWISAYDNMTLNVNNTNPCQVIPAYPATWHYRPYSFWREFCVCNNNTTLVINIDMLVDNIADIYLDGTDLLGTQHDQWIGSFQTPFSGSYTRVVNSGPHHLQIDVRNDSGQSMGLNVSGNITTSLGNLALLNDACCQPWGKLRVKKAEVKDCDANNTNGPGVAQWPITVTSVPPTPTYTEIKYTDGIGYCNFDNLPPGTYTVCEGTLSGWTQVYPSSPPCYTITITAGVQVEVEFGNCQSGETEPCACLYNPINVSWTGYAGGPQQQSAAVNCNGTVNIAAVIANTPITLTPTSLCTGDCQPLPPRSQKYSWHIVKDSSTSINWGGGDDTPPLFTLPGTLSPQSAVGAYTATFDWKCDNQICQCVIHINIAEIGGIAKEGCVPPRINQLMASSTQIKAGEPVMLNWSITGQGNAYLTCGGEQRQVGLTGSQSITPPQSGCCTLSVSNSCGSDQKQVCITVASRVPAPVINSLDFNCGQSSPTGRVPATCTLTWNVTGPTGTIASIQPGIGPVNLSGSMQVQRGTYTLTATSAGGSATRTITVQ